jgi:hypothetical protein
LNWYFIEIGTQLPLDARACNFCMKFAIWHLQSYIEATHLNTFCQNDNLWITGLITPLQGKYKALKD